jgi:glycosyltransferase involved in cell wall biosynthesis
LPEESLEYNNRWNGQIHINGVVVKKPFVLLTNRHTPQKRFEYALWALKKIKNEIPNLSLVITGQETQYTDELRSLVETLNLVNRVQFIGLVTEDDLENLYKAAALYVYPSPEEDFGMGIIEAMAAGTPVVAWDRGGPTFTIKDGETGYLIKPYDAYEFAEKMMILANEPSLVEEMGRAAHKRVKEHFSYDRHHQILEEALLEALAIYTLKIAEKATPSPQPSLVEEEGIDIRRYP